MLVQAEEGRALAAEYCRIVPAAVHLAGRKPSARELLDALRADRIAPGCCLLRAGRGDEARRLYTEGVLMLWQRFGAP